MLEFPAKFVPANLPHFEEYQYGRDLCYLRVAIYEHSIRERPPTKEVLTAYEVPFDLLSFRQKYQSPSFEKMVETVCTELKQRGWETRVGQVGNALWVFDPKTPPRSLPEW